MAKEQEPILEEQDDHQENRVYELGFHLDAELPQEEVKKKYQEVRGAIDDVGTVLAEGEPTKIPLAYSISRQETTGRRDFTSAFFCWIAYETKGEGHESIVEFARSQPSIIRFLDIRTTKDAAKHSAELQELFMRQMEGREDESDDSDDEEGEEKSAEKEEAV